MRYEPRDDPGLAAPDPAGGRAAARSHWWPRTRAGVAATVAFIALFALAQPPFVHALANRIEPRVLGMPFLYVYLLLVYLAMIGVLLWSRWRGL